MTADLISHSVADEPIMNGLMRQVDEQVDQAVAEATERTRWQIVEARWHPNALEIVIDGVSQMIPAHEGALPAFRFDRGPEPTVIVSRQ